MITSEKTIVGNLVGTYAELVELMALADRGLGQAPDARVPVERCERRACTIFTMGGSTVARSYPMTAILAPGPDACGLVANAESRSSGG